MGEYKSKLKIIKKHSGILLGSVRTYDCNPTMDCPECKGTGTCQICHGLGEEKCRNCHGTGRCIDCNGRGQWPCNVCGGSGLCRTCHGTGDVMCTKCRGKGTIKDGDFNWKKCPKCGGSGRTPCPDCRSGMQTAVKALSYMTLGHGSTYGHGSGKCSNCGGLGQIICKTCQGTGQCTKCGGRGLVTCHHCAGSGKCPNCDNGQVVCERCDGSGFYQSFIRQNATLYSKKWVWAGSSEYRDVVKSSKGEILYEGLVKKWSDAKIVKTDIVEKVNSKVASDLGKDKELYKEFLSKYAEQTDLKEPNDTSDKPYAQLLKVQKVPVTKIKYTLNHKDYEILIVGDNKVVAMKSIPTSIEEFELTIWEKVKLAMTEKSRLKAYARLAAYIFKCDGKSLEESTVLEPMIKALKMQPNEESKFRKELQELNTQMPYEKVRKMIKPLLSSKKTISFTWQCMAVDKKISPEEETLFNFITSEYTLEPDELEHLKRIAKKFSKLKRDQIAIEYANLSDEFAGIRKRIKHYIFILTMGLLLAIFSYFMLLLIPDSPQPSNLRTTAVAPVSEDDNMNSEESSDTTDLQLQLEKKYDYVGDAEDGYIEVQKGEHYGLVSAETGKAVLEPIYDYIGNVENGFMEIQKDEKYGLFNIRTGQISAQCNYDYISSLEDGVFEVRRGEKYGLLSSEGKEIVAPEYDYISSFDGDYAQVEKNGKYGTISKKDKLVKPLE